MLCLWVNGQLNTAIREPSRILESQDRLKEWLQELWWQGGSNHTTISVSGCFLISLLLVTCSQARRKNKLCAKIPCSVLHFITLLYIHWFILGLHTIRYHSDYVSLKDFVCELCGRKLVLEIGVCRFCKLRHNLYRERGSRFERGVFSGRNDLIVRKSGLQLRKLDPIDRHLWRQDRAPGFGQ